MEDTMTATNLKSLTFGAATLMAASVLLATGGAEAKGGYGTTVVEEHFITKGPMKGYSGFAWGGPRSVYCDYQRIPNRVCTIGSDGRERCKIESWTLKQFCY
jgi:hypothetical protein